ACWARSRISPADGISAATTPGSDDSITAFTVSPSGSSARYGTSSTSPAVIDCAPIASTTGERFGCWTVTSNCVVTGAASPSCTVSTTDAVPGCAAVSRITPGPGTLAATTPGLFDTALAVSVSPSGSDALYPTSRVSPTL